MSSSRLTGEMMTSPLPMLACGSALRRPQKVQKPFLKLYAKCALARTTGVLQSVVPSKAALLPCCSNCPSLRLCEAGIDVITLSDCAASQPCHAVQVALCSQHHTAQCSIGCETSWGGASGSAHCRHAQLATMPDANHATLHALGLMLTTSSPAEARLVLPKIAQAGSTVMMVTGCADRR